MFPSSSRVKLNRVALKDVVGLQLTPRRRRVPKLLNRISAESKKQEKNFDSVQLISEKDMVSPPGSNEPDQNLTHTMGSEKKTQPPSTHDEEEPEENGSDVGRHKEPNLSGLTGSEVLLRRAVGASHCGVCGECKYTSPQRKAPGKLKRASPGSEPPATQSEIEKENTITQSSKKIIVWINQYPKVILCDVAKKCEACGHDCGYVLPDALENKVVRCFQQEMRASIRFWPTCLRHNESETEKKALFKSSKCCPSAQDEKTVCQSQSLIRQNHLDEGMHSQPLSHHTVSPFHRSQTGEDSATCSASFLLDEHTKTGNCRGGMRDRDAEVDLGPGSDPVSPETCREKGKVGDSIECSSTLDFAPTDKCSASGGQKGDPTNADGSHVLSDLIDHVSDEDTDAPESYTCQRVRAYLRKIHFSCARTYMAWPFSKTCTANASTTAGTIDPSAKDGIDSATANQSMPGSSSNLFKDIPPRAPTEKWEEDGESAFAQGNEKRHRKDMETSPLFNQPEELETRPNSDTASFPPPAQCGRERGTDGVSASALLVNGPETVTSISTPSPSVLGLSDWDTATTLSLMSSPFTQGSMSSLSATTSSLPPSSLIPKRVNVADKILSSCEEAQTASSSPNVPLHSPDSFHTCESFVLPQDEYENDKEPFPCRSPPRLDPYYCASSFRGNASVGSLLCSISQEHCVESDLNEFMLPPLLSPVHSPQRQLCQRSFSCCSSSSTDEEEMNKDVSNLPQNDNCKDCLEHHIEELERDLSDFTTPETPREPQSSPSSEEESDDEDDVEQGNRISEQVSLHRKIKPSLSSGVLTEPCSSSCSDEKNGAALSDGESHSDTEEGSSPSKIANSEEDKTQGEAAGDSQPGILDELTAYEQDILLVDVIQDDPELFDNLPDQSLLKLGPTRAAEAPGTKPAAVVNTPRRDGASQELQERLAPVTVDLPCDSPNNTEESNSRPWRPHSSSTHTGTQSDTCPTSTEKQSKHVVQSDTNSSHVNSGPERSQPIKTVNSFQNIPPLMSMGTAGAWITNSANMMDFRRLKSSSYCRLYFSESLTCGFKMCRFQHLPMEGDEKFCIENVTRFIKNPTCLQKAGAVFTGYYQKNPPGVYFSLPIFFSLLWALLKAGMLSEVFSVLSVGLAHNIVPSHEFLLSLFNCVREKGVMGFVPELMQLTFKMANAGLELSLDCLDCVRNTPLFQQMIHPNSPSVSGNNKVSSGAPFPEYLNLAHSIVEMELCMKQEDWRRIGEVFRGICQSNQHPSQVERISGRIAVALLSEGKDKLSLPFSVFAETVCQNESEDSMVRSFVGRIGVSLMLRYHKTHQWAKGRRVVETLSVLKVGFSTLKGLFGNEDGASRCCLITVAAEVFLLSGSVEGALNTLRENKWFLSSSSWPCEPADLESRTRVLIRLAEKTSHRDTLELLCNLPGVKESSDSMDISRYSPLFNSHLQVCVDRQILPVASDTVDFMLSKNLAVDHTVLRILLQKLGKQNLWLRAREVFKHSLSVGYYPGVSAPPGFMTLIVPCRLGEVELALTFEMFITVNATVIHHLSEPITSLTITLKRTQSCESEYLSAGSRLLSAACIPQPKLIVHYTAVNSEQEQVFMLDVPSARRWLRHNHLWAHEVWTH
uniref:testis- and ovary-specific PAZ domain-containing protein 1 isoform X3 n=1 Tax=Maylandia zebra TaxID=106582 RepID=UPI000D2F9336|nr:testis- and ovary-specific PAZ domain-containing protein 1 isoform X3 [Maylandia zebra]